MARLLPFLVFVCIFVGIIWSLTLDVRRPIKSQPKRCPHPELIVVRNIMTDVVVAGWCPDCTTTIYPQEESDE